MRILTFNANGIRSAANKGFLDWLKKQNVDVVCLQETKAQEEQLTDPMFRPDGHHCFYRDATTKKGYSGVAILARREPDEVRTALGRESFDEEGRYIEARFGNLSVVSLYVPSGSSGDERQQFKFKVMDWITPIFDAWRKSGRDYVICGDWNIVHTRNDIKNWSSNQKNSGCLPEERAWLDLLFQQRGWVDSFPCAQARCGRIHLVVQSWCRARKQCRLAHRLSNCHAGHRYASESMRDYTHAAVFRPCAVSCRVRYESREVTETLRGWRSSFASYAHPRVRAMLLLGFAAGLPFPLVLTTLSARLRQSGIDRTTIGYFSLVGLAYSLKFCWSPIVDRLGLPLLQRLGRRHATGLLLAQCGIVFGIVAMALADPAVNAERVAWLAVLTAFASATQDIAVDAYRIEAVDASWQGAMAAA